MAKKKKKHPRKWPYQKPAGSIEHRMAMAKDFSKMIDAGAEPDEQSLVHAVIAANAFRWMGYTDQQMQLLWQDLTAAAQMAIVHHSLPK